MASDNEPAKLLLPYLQRADELQKHEPLVAYYCRLYAMEKGLKIPQTERTKTTNSLLISLMNQLEKDKKSLNLGPEDNLHIEGFALNVFAKADKQDRAGRADLSTAKTFYAASIFFEILNQFGPLQPDLEQKQKYAVWKAAEIRKALKEGRRPNPGPPSGDDDPLVPSNGYDLGPNETATPHSQSDPDPSPTFLSQVDNQHSAAIPPTPPPQFYENVSNQHSAHIPMQPQFHDSVNNQHSMSNIPPPSQPYQTSTYPSHEFSSPPENSSYSQQYHHQSFSQEPQQYPTHSYPSSEASPYSYPNFQSYPSFAESSLPSVPTRYPSYSQGSDSSYSVQHQSAPASSYASSAQYTSTNRTNSDPTPISTQTYQYDPNYQPPPEKIAEAHKAARFAVGALAFDEVAVAVEHLKKSLELLTNPSAGH